MGAPTQLCNNFMPANLRTIDCAQIPAINERRPSVLVFTSTLISRKSGKSSVRHVELLPHEVATKLWLQIGYQKTHIITSELEWTYNQIQAPTEHMIKGNIY